MEGFSRWRRRVPPLGLDSIGHHPTNTPSSHIPPSTHFPFSKGKAKQSSGLFADLCWMLKMSDIWSSIISQNADDDESSKSVPVPYIHPLVKRSASSLSVKSLEICTESLGSETGSDGFSSYPPSETGDMHEDDHREKDQQLCFDHGVEPRIVKHYNYDIVGKKSFPPPIPSLSSKDGSSLRIKTHRHNGILVLEAVSFPSQNNFVAQRKNGRLVLTFSSTEEDEVGEFEEEHESFGEEDKESEMNPCCEMEEAMNVLRLAVIMNKPICLTNRNPTWPKNFDDMVKLETEDKVEATIISPPLGQVLPPRMSSRLIPSSPLSTAAATSFMLTSTIGGNPINLCQRQQSFPIIINNNC
ncbi:hypothetical protein F3Y22_tig00110293pilonHSYRG00056 [Hibiscus syriacus]|uniref:FAF domain-containing protein n=1 Tax=Hibiscus syriacus TaxID=106335 RepID=A0A6A3B966_HIBSY|nr:hypothetical protein F3Y22_tig00110293pilonHSYRG00056 [Hibiscus syriacus]